MKVCFRTDASFNIGTGHVMRCLTLADELRKKGTDINFICREEVGHLNELIEQRGFRVHTLPANLDFVSDRVITQEILESQFKSPEWLVVDHYGIDIAWESSLREQVKKIMVIDDLADRTHDCDLLLDQNYNESTNRYQRLVPSTCTQLLGPKYALLRPQFSKARKRLRNRTSKVKHILVLMGGTDPNNQTCKVLHAINMLNRSDISTDVVIGASNPSRIKIESLASNIPNSTCYYNIDNIDKLMVSSDLAVSAGGTTIWELCCIALPSIVIQIAENQIESVKSLGKEGLITDLGWFEQVTEHHIKNALQVLINDSGKSKLMSIKGRKMVDGKGKKRIAEAICKLS